MTHKHIHYYPYFLVSPKYVLCMGFINKKKLILSSHELWPRSATLESHINIRQESIVYNDSPKLIK